jgi:hypothetical protein
MLIRVLLTTKLFDCLLIVFSHKPSHYQNPKTPQLFRLMKHFSIIHFKRENYRERIYIWILRCNYK